jgi:predicted transcriptional regulator
MDWLRVHLPRFDNTKLLVQQLADLDYAKVLVVAHLLKSSRSQVAQTAIYEYVARNWDAYEERLALEAGRQGLSPEELFQRIVLNEVNE